MRHRLPQEDTVDSTWAGTRRDVLRAVLAACVVMGLVTSLGAYAFDRTLFSSALWFVLGCGVGVGPAVGSWHAIEHAWLRRLCGGLISFAAPLMPATLVLYGWTRLDLPPPLPQLAALLVYLLPAALGWHVEGLRREVLDAHEAEMEGR